MLWGTQDEREKLLALWNQPPPPALA